MLSQSIKAPVGLCQRVILCPNPAFLQKVLSDLHLNQLVELEEMEQRTNLPSKNTVSLSAADKCIQTNGSAVFML